ncbi:glycosyltransferase family 9 protein [Melioribacter sp. OK-6-Me]|uniref:glycosyltransferase family 9 protein n=1 Tax=unclassified Melioribacter TaxID=2627329 RepID=UPI003F5CF923
MVTGFESFDEISKFAIKNGIHFVNENRPLKILVIRLSSLGDVILTTPVIRALKSKYNNSEIDFVVKPQYVDALKYNKYLNRVLQYEINNKKELLKYIASRNYDIVVDLQNNLRSNRINIAAGGQIFRFRKPTAKKIFLSKFRINLYDKIKSIPELYSTAVPGLKLDDYGTEVFLPNDIHIELDEGNYIGVCPGSKHFTKMWPSDYFVQLGNKIYERGIKTLLFGGRDDRELCNTIASRIPEAVDLSTDDDLLNLAAHMKRCKLVVSNDTGLMHLAASQNIPLIVIFGSSVKEFGFLPYKVKFRLVENEGLRCRPCSHIGRENCPRGHFKCMTELTPELVFNNIIELLEDR